MELDWQDPPSRQKTKSKELDAIAATLKKNPGRWARVLTRNYAGGTNAYSSRGLETSVRKNATGTFDVFAMAPKT